MPFQSFAKLSSLLVVPGRSPIDLSSDYSRWLLEMGLQACEGLPFLWDNDAYLIDGFQWQRSIGMLL